MCGALRLLNRPKSFRGRRGVWRMDNRTALMSVCTCFALEARVGSGRLRRLKLGAEDAEDSRFT